MNTAISQMLSKYRRKSLEDHENALKEIIQQIALLGLWRVKFFERAAFYGGTALRIFYGLERFSEDLDFSLFSPDKKFEIDRYCDFVKAELEGFGFTVDVRKKEKLATSAVQSAFIKTGTMNNLIMIKTPEQIVKRVSINRVIKVKMEVDIDPPAGFKTEAKYLLQPIPFSVLVYKLPDLFAGKLHAILCREWKSRVKGRDWFDLVWYIGRDVPVRLLHLEQRMRQTGHLDGGISLNRELLIELLNDKIEKVDFASAKKDVLPMLKDVSSVEIWSKEFFRDLIQRLRCE